MIPEESDEVEQWVDVWFGPALTGIGEHKAGDKGLSRRIDSIPFMGVGREYWCAI